MIDKNCKKIRKFSFGILQFFCNFHNFPYIFGKINIDIEIPFPRPHENNQERSKYPFFQLISAKLLYSLCCGGPCTCKNALATVLIYSFTALVMVRYDNMLLLHSNLGNSISCIVIVVTI